MVGRVREAEIGVLKVEQGGEGGKREEGKRGGDGIVYKGGGLSI